MAAGNFVPCLNATLVHEGGWSDHPKDPGGATMKGVTLATFRRYKPGATKTQLRNIGDADLQMIYRDGYWSKVRGDRLPFGVDLATFDYAVNSGPARGAKELQKAVGVKADGDIGEGTLKAIGLTGPKIVIQKLCARRGSFFRSLSTFKTFGKGWMRRLADIEAKAVAMWLSSGGDLKPWHVDELKDDAADADRRADTQNKGAGGLVAGGSTAGGGAVTVGDINWLVVAAVGVILIAGIVAIIVKARHNRERAAAYRAVAAAG